MAKRWEKVLVSDDGNKWNERIYITTIEWSKYPYVCVDVDDEEDYNDWKPFSVCTWEYIKI